MNEGIEPQSQVENEQADMTKKPRDLRLHAALVRTAISSEQTLMSWMRTAVSMFTFGFSITQFFFYLDQKQESTNLSEGPRRLGLVLISVGIMALVLALHEHVQRLQRMKEQGLPSNVRFFLPIYSAAMLLALGVAALISILFKWSF